MIEINPLNLQNSNRKINLNSSDYENNDINIFTRNSSFNNYVNNSIVNETSIDKFDTSESYSETDSSTVDQKYKAQKSSENKNKLLFKNDDDRNNNSSGIEIKIDSESCKIEEDWDKVDELLGSPRRASDSFCDVSSVFNSKIDENEERRFSDGLISDVAPTGEMKRRKKNSLRRQARISDAEAIEYCGVNDESTGPNTSSSSSGDKCTLDTTGKKKFICDTKKQHLCCKNDELEQVCEHEEGYKDCCYHVGNTSCWKKMKKMIQKNQKLENMVVKSRQEMAEIREMLNNVLSIRMEPGF